MISILQTKKRRYSEQDLCQGGAGWMVELRSECWQSPPSTIVSLLHVENGTGARVSETAQASS